MTVLANLKVKAEHVDNAAGTWGVRKGFPKLVQGLGAFGEIARLAGHAEVLHCVGTTPTDGRQMLQVPLVPGLTPEGGHDTAAIADSTIASDHSLTKFEGDVPPLEHGIKCTGTLIYTVNPTLNHAIYPPLLRVLTLNRIRGLFRFKTGPPINWNRPLQLISKSISNPSRGRREGETYPNLWIRSDGSQKRRYWKREATGMQCLISFEATNLELRAFEHGGQPQDSQSPQAGSESQFEEIRPGSEKTDRKPTGLDSCRAVI